ncbi:Ferredoxin-NADP reductase [Halogranum amylolyticum]|uniref:Ferredoxin-NADP reductase n=1 Tax=Halogranum amylolyticum TaxID=660520 RepID=A0A1H8U5U6_9EURY|nr:FAD-dependent oxidoreductase [Halogranum amylolyticum]SEO98213.1 Ferredoxin-NADP reductase [Halogranum amylolyticum]
MTYEMTVDDVTRLTPDVKQFHLVAADHSFDFRPGQHTTVQFEQDGEEVVRPYTVTNLPGTDELTLAIRRYDDGTASVWMHERERGDTVEVGDVDGNLYVRDFDSDVVFVATGTGITPMAAMLRDYADRGDGDAHLFVGEKTREDLIYRETFDRTAASNDNVDVTYSLSEEDWDGATGHVQHRLTDELDSLEGRDFYVCGVPQMVVETTDLLKDEGVSEDHIYTEGWEGDEVADEDEDGDGDE